MKRQISVFALLTFFVAFSALGQSPSYTAVEKAEMIPWQQFIPESKRFIVGGEAHHVSVNFPFQLSQLKYLVTKGFRHLVWEVPFSAGYIGQQYILTGNDSLLHYLAWSKEALDYWKEIYQINQSLNEGEKLYIWGIDHELGDNSGGSYRARGFKIALQLMIQGKGDLPPVLQKEFISLQKDTSNKSIAEIKQRLKAVQSHPEVAAFFGERLSHFKALVNRLDYYKVSRNDEMMEAFKEICSLFELDSSARYLGRFGWGHTDKSYRKSMSWLLENDPFSPVKGSTFVIGVQYLNCESTGRMGGAKIENAGIVNDRSQKKELATLNLQDPSPIKMFMWPSGEKKKGWAKEADVLFVFSGYPGVTILKEVR